MGLLNKLKQNVDSVKAKTEEIKSSAESVKDKALHIAIVQSPENDSRPAKPQDLKEHEQKECLKVIGTYYCQAAINALHNDTVDVTIEKKKNDWDMYSVITSDGIRIGSLSEELIAKANIKKGVVRQAEIRRPFYQSMDETEVYLPLSREEIEYKEKLESLKLWINIDEKKWEGGDGDRFDYYNVVILADESGSGKPKYVVLGDGSKLFEVGSRMKSYDDLRERAQLKVKPRHLIVERKQGDYGPYYHIGFYY